MVINNNLVSIGKIVAAFGINGWVKIKTDTDPNNFKARYKELHIRINNQKNLLTVESFFVKNDSVYLKFADINNRDQAIGLKGSIISVPRNNFPQLENDEYYWIDLIGLKVINLKQELLGTVHSLLETGPHSVLVVKLEKKQHLIPFVAKYVTEVNIQQKYILVDWETEY